MSKEPVSFSSHVSDSRGDSGCSRGENRDEGLQVFTALLPGAKVGVFWPRSHHGAFPSAPLNPNTHSTPITSVDLGRT